MVQEAQWDVPFSLGRRHVTECLMRDYHGEPILASMGSLAHYMQELSHAGIGIRNFVHEGNLPYWQEAIEAPRWSSTAFPASSGQFTMRPGTLSVESRVPPEVQDALKAKGHKLTTSGPWTQGSNAAISVDPKTGVLKAGADPRVDAYAWAR